ncbi:transketolase [Candidatus Planktophila dulcis]|uniref:Transketolase n=1 Tax=Candidatus Planktophila dulcis TaxID=1884914 RepID=A0AAD0E5D7_9ACTN|nr:transketolase [Candidatus Planktophila dulcis]ASY11958.1 transketolase [Candidatus Planktophila dulcis]ASY21201.1 transketolase [Candidatus Planktophila dulcis]
MSKIAGWTELDDRAVAYARALAMDAVQKVGNGHPGTAMALAPVAYNLFQRHLVHDPSDPQWLGRDRFILSCGHSSMTLYTQLFFSGYGLEMEDIQSFRTWGSLTPGHPEFGHTAGVEMTTGPLGAGVATSVGFAMAARYERGLLDPEAPAGTSLFDHSIWVICSDGDLQEGVSGEASSLAGTQELGNLNIIYDDNRISIEGDTHVSFTEDVAARYRAYGWHVQDVPALSDGNVDLESLDKAMIAAKAEKTKPSLIRMHSIIAWPAPKLRGTGKSHGSALGDEEIAATKKELGLNPDEKFAMPEDVFAHVRAVKARGAATRKEWDSKFEQWQKAHPDRAALLKRLVARELPAGWESALPSFEAGKDVATRTASGHVINAIAKSLPEFWGGSADLADSNMTTIEGGNSFLPATSAMKNADPYGRIIHFGIREHAMGSIINGITLHGLSRSFGGTFAVFSDYMRPSVRLAAIMDIPSIFVWTHDSIGVGEDGPTHQPIEHFAALRAIPNFAVLRPADANEVTEAWKSVIKRNKPAGFLLSRQNLRTVDRTTHGAVSGVDKGAYILKEASSTPKVVIIATGSEVGIALDAQIALEAEGVSTRVVSAPCLEWFNEQTISYRESVLPTSSLRVSIEAGIALGWREYVGDKGVIISLDHWGASASAAKLFTEFGLTSERVVSDVKKALA